MRGIRCLSGADKKEKVSPPFPASAMPFFRTFLLFLDKIKKEEVPLTVRGFRAPLLP